MNLGQGIKHAISEEVNEDAWKIWGCERRTRSLSESMRLLEHPVAMVHWCRYPPCQNFHQIGEQEPSALPFPMA